MAWMQALAGMGFTHQGTVKGWRKDADGVEIWYRVGNALVGRSEIEGLLEWIFGNPSCDPRTPDVLVWPQQAVKAQIVTEEGLTRATVSGLTGIPNSDLAMNFSLGQTIH